MAAPTPLTAEEVLRHQSLAFYASMDGMAILDADGHYVFLNDAHARIYGYDPTELVGKPWTLLYAASERQRFESEILPRLFKEGRWRGEAEGLRRDGSLFPQEISLTAIAGRGLVCVVRDISERRRSERLQSALFRIAEATDSVEEMASLYAAIHAIVGEFMYARNLYIALYDAESATLSFPYVVEEVEDDSPNERPPGRGLTEYILRTGEPLLAPPDVFERLIAAGEVEPIGEPSVDWLGVPLKRGETTFGVLAVQSYTEAIRYAESDLELLTFVSRHVAAAIDRRRAADKLRESEEKFRTLADTAPAAIFIYQGDSFRYANEATAAISGYTREEFLKLPSFWAIVHPDSAEDVQRRGLARQRGEKVPSRYEVKIVRRDGEERWLDYSAGVIEYGGRPAVMGTAFDVTERKRAEAQITSLAYHDTLTGLPNRLLFADRLTLAVAQAHRRGRRLGVLFLDVDRFKLINDSLGHSVGDRLLKALARRLAGTIRDEDTVARLGGDEFILLLPDASEAADVVTVAEKILESVRKPVRIDESELFVTASIGISLYPDDGTDPEALVKNADTAMYRAKEQGRDSVSVYAAAMNATAVERLEMENAFRKALVRDELVIYYQPILDLASGRPLGVEALLRWRRPEAGIVSPLDFIPMAEATGLILPVGPWLFRTACAQVKRWQQRIDPTLRLAVNLSARQFQQPELGAQVLEAAKATDFPLACLDLEITESYAMQNADSTIHTLRDLKGLGVGISIDDFGIGYSSLSYLKRFPIDTLKIDRSFVRDIASDPDDAAIVTAVIAMAHSLKLKVVAEGVETDAQRAFLLGCGCDRVQGFLFAPPLPAEECEKLLR